MSRERQRFHGIIRKQFVRESWNRTKRRRPQQNACDNLSNTENVKRYKTILDISDK